MEYVTQTWKQIRLFFETKEKKKDPFREVRIWAYFHGPNGKVIKREAYWEGDNRYGISFAPTTQGRWTFELKADGAQDLDKIKGTVICEPYTGELPIYQHGFLKVHPTKRYLTYQDGTAFFWLGDTHWEFAYKELWETSNHPQMESMFKGMVDRRVEQGYSVYQTNLRSDAIMHGNEKYWKETMLNGKKVLLPNVEFYQTQLDRRMEYIAEHGLVNALGQAWFMSIQDDVTGQKELARYLVARYGALPIVWTLAGEVAGYSGEKERTIYIDGWREVAKYIEELDGYGNLQTAHYTNERPFAEYYQNEDWFDFTLNQAGHGDYPISANDYKDFMKKHPKKPFIEAEALYEFCSTLEEMGTRLCTADMLRRVAYMSIQLGGCGYTYGAQGIWDNVLEKGLYNPMNLFNRYDITWYEAIDGEGGAQMGYMKAFYEKEKFWEMEPFEGGQDSNLFAKKAPFATINENKNKCILYYSDATRKELEIKDLVKGVYEGCWFNPRTNEYISMEQNISVEEGFKTPKKKGEGDWVLVLKHIGC